MRKNDTRAYLRRLVCLVLMMSLAMGLWPLSAQAASNGVVTMDKVLFRKSISGTDYWDYLYTGWVMEIQSTQVKNGTTWYYVKGAIPSQPARTYWGYLKDTVFRPMTAAEEAAWQLNPVQPGASTGTGSVTPPATGPVTPPSVSTGTGLGKIRITKGGTNLRERPEGMVIEVLDRGTELNYFAEPTYAYGYNWIYASNPNTYAFGYVRSDCYEIISGAPAGSGATQAKVTANGVNMRDSASDAGTSVAVLNKETVVNVLETPADLVNGWYKVSYGSATGFIKASWLTALPATPVVPGTPVTPVTPGGEGYIKLIKGGVNLRLEPWGQSITQLPRDTVLPYYGFAQKSGSMWYYVMASQGAGYILSTMAVLTDAAGTPTGGTPSGPVGPVSPGSGAMGYVLTLKPRINLRKTPYMDNNTLTQVDKGKVYAMKGPMAQAGGYSWYFVTTEANTGYLRSDMVRQLTTQEVSDYLTKGTIPGATPTTPVTPTGYVQTTIKDAIIRQAPAVDALKLGTVDMGQVYVYQGTVTSGGQTWQKVTYGAVTGYILASQCKIMTLEEYNAWLTAGGGTAIPGVPVTPGAGELSLSAVTVMDKVLVRKSGSMSAGTVTLIYRAGTMVKLSGKSATADGYSWYEVTANSVGGWMRADMLRVLTKAEEAAALGTGTGTTTPGAPAEATYRVLQRGSTGEDVKRVQNELIRLGYLAAGQNTGTYTTATMEAVRAYQKANGLVADGLAGPVTQHKMFGTVAPGTGTSGSGGSTVIPTLMPVEKVDWYKGDIQTVWARGAVALITDVKTGISFRAKRWAGGYHADVEPLTAADTAAMCRIYNVKSAQEILERNLYERRPLWVTINGRSFAASMYGVPHNYPAGDTIADNNFSGQFCVHFINSRTHSSGKVDPGHMAAIDYAYTHAPTKK